MAKYRWLSSMIFLTACAAQPAAVAPVPSVPQETPAARGTHCCTGSTRAENFAALEARIEALAAENAALAQQIKNLESRQESLAQSIALAVEVSGSRGHLPQQEEDTAYFQAQQALHSGQYSRAVSLLNDSAGAGGQKTADALWLLLQAHEKLENCESVIVTGRQLARRFPQHIHAPDALLSTARCQFSMQQKDIARQTAAALKTRYPDSRAAHAVDEIFERRKP